MKLYARSCVCVCVCVRAFLSASRWISPYLYIYLRIYVCVGCVCACMSVHVCVCAGCIYVRAYVCKFACVSVTPLQKTARWKPYTSRLSLNYWAHPSGLGRGGRNSLNPPSVPHLAKFIYHRQTTEHEAGWALEKCRQGRDAAYGSEGRRVREKDDTGWGCQGFFSVLLSLSCSLSPSVPLS